MDELYHFRDCYFETHSMEDAEKKDSDVTQEMEKTLKSLQEKEGEWSSCTIFLPCRTNTKVCPNFPQISLNTKQSSCCRRDDV